MNKRRYLSGLLGSAVGAFAIITYLRYQQEIDTAYRNILTGSNVFLTRFGTQEYAIVGSGPPVLVIHGIGGGFDHGLLVGRLIDDQYRIISPSRFGYLRSMLPEDASPSVQADAFAALLDELQIEQCAVAGISAGGPSSLQFALRHPDRCSSLLMISAVSKHLPLESRDHSSPLERIYRSDFPSWLVVGNLRPLIKKWQSLRGKNQVQISPVEKAWADDYYAAALPTSRRFDGARNDILQLTTLDSYHLEDILSPTLVIHADDDRVVTLDQAEHTAQRIPCAELVILPSGGHMLLGHHKKIRTIILEFLNRHESE